MGSTTKTAVLLITFNRPSNTRKVFEQIRLARTHKLYVFNDAPRESNETDTKARIEIKQMLEEIDWPCQLFTFFPESNMGCARGVSSAITWAFEKEEKLIILEDDCVPAQSFFPYCDGLLERYNTDTRVWMISGNNYNEEFPLDSSYTFSRNAIHIWGWATWKRCWQHYSIGLDIWPEFVSAGGFSTLFSSIDEIRFWSNRYNKLFADKEKATSKTWDYQYVLSLFVNGGLCIVPAKNLVTNIGYEGTHTNEKHIQHDKSIDQHFSIKKHPQFILPNRAYDIYHLKSLWMKKKPLYNRISTKVRKITNKKMLN